MSSTDFDIIMLALPRWDGAYSSTAYSLAKELSRYSRVFYIDNPFTYKDYLSGRNAKQIEKRKNALLWGKDVFATPDADYPNLVAVTPRFVIPINWLPQGFLYNALSRINDALVMRALDETIRSYAVKKYVFINSFNPLFGKYFPARFKPALNLYHCVDDISKSAYVSKHGTRLENESVAKADMTLVTSMELLRLKSMHSTRVYYLPNAADVPLFQTAVHEDLIVPEEIKRITPGKKIIIYTGNICHRLDYDLLVKIATQHADKILFMVGPLANDKYRKAGLDKMPNVIFAGSKPIDKLPAYLKYSHCCIIPFLCIPLTKSIYPLKINEYLSAGKPVVTTNFSEDIANFADVAFVANNHDSFLQSIETATATDSPEKVTNRVQYSSQNSWSYRAKQFMDIITNHTGKNG